MSILCGNWGIKRSELLREKEKKRKQNDRERELTFGSTSLLALNLKIIKLLIGLLIS